MTTKKMIVGPIRVTPEDRERIRQAAEIERRKVTDFMRLAVLDKVEEVLKRK